MHVDEQLRVLLERAVNELGIRRDDSRGFQFAVEKMWPGGVLQTSRTLPLFHLVQVAEIHNTHHNLCRKIVGNSGQYILAVGPYRYL